MQMTQEEIRSRYNRAEDKKAIVPILADLNGTDERTIRSIVETQPEPEPEKAETGRKLLTQKERAEIIRAMLIAGKPVNQIAEAAGCSEETVRTHAKKLKLEAVAAAEKEQPAPEQAVAAKAARSEADRAADILLAMPADAAKETKLLCYELCRSMLRNAAK